MAAEYGVCFKCNSPIYKSKATGRAWWHVDYRQADHRPVPTLDIKNVENEMLKKAARA